MTKVYLTRNAIFDIQAIYDYSIAKWNESVAESYLSSILSAEIDLLRRRAKKVSDELKQ